MSDVNAVQLHNVLIDRYLSILNSFRPDLKAKKNKDGSLELSHAKWMLEKMKEPTFVHLTHPLMWLTWIQASLYHHNMINIMHEKDITRDIARQYKEL